MVGSAKKVLSILSDSSISIDHLIEVNITSFLNGILIKVIRAEEVLSFWIREGPSP